jgi:hypothetical protein
MTQRPLVGPVQPTAMQARRSGIQLPLRVRPNVTATGALALGATLDELATRRAAGKQQDLAGRLQRQAKVNRAPWILLTGADLRAGAEGPQVRGFARLVHRRLARVLPLTTEHAAAR